MRVANYAKAHHALMMVVPPVWAIREDCLTVPALVPAYNLQELLWDLLQSRKGGQIDEGKLALYRNGYRRQLFVQGEAGHLSPGRLTGVTLVTQREVVLTNEHTLICTCRIDHAKQGHCHRCWVVPALRYYGWQVRADFEPDPGLFGGGA